MISVITIPFILLIFTFAESAEPSYLKVVVLVNNTGGGTAKPSDFKVDLDEDNSGVLLPTNNAQPSSFAGSAKGVISVLLPGKYIVKIDNLIINDTPYSLDFSGDCLGKGLTGAEVVIQPSDKKTCIITASYPNF